MKATKMRAYPTKGQQNRANQMLKIHCDMYNACIQERIQAYRINKTNVNYKMQSAQLKHVRENDPVCEQYSFSGEQRTIKRVDKAFKAFFQRVKQGQTPGFPRYKPYKRFNTVDHTAGDGSKWVPTQGKWAKAYFQGIGHIKVSEHTHIEGKIKQISLTREGRKWWVIVVHENQPNMLPSTGRSIGFDLGIARFLTTSDGEIIENPRFNQKVSDELADLQLKYAESKYKSKVLRRKIAKLYRKTKNQRLDFHHKTARTLVNSCDAIGFENLDVKNMVKRCKPKSDGQGGWLPNGASAKTGLNRSISDVGWGQFISILKVKAEDAGRKIVGVNPAYTSIRCHKCQSVCVRPSQDVVVCEVHGSQDADLNGALNVFFRAGLGSTISIGNCLL